MANFKLVIGDSKSGKSYQKEVGEENSEQLIGLKIGDTFPGESVDMAGYEFTITGGSDYAGFPMRRDVEGNARKRIFTTRSIGVKITGHGQKKRKLVAGNTVHERTAQINVTVAKYGKEPLEPKQETERTESSGEEGATEQAKEE